MALDRYTVLALSFPLALAAGAQSITLVAPGNVPVAGTSYLQQRGAYAAPPAGGEGLLFDFSAGASTSSITYMWEDPATLPNAALFPGAQLALTNGGPDTLFYTAPAAGMERVGDTQTIIALGTPYHFAAPYTNSVLELKLPLTYGNTWTDLFDGTFTVDGQSASRTGGINGTADAWGNVVLPGGLDTVEVLRVTTRLTETITITGIPFPINHVRNVSAYIPLWGKIPVFRNVSDSLTSTVTNQISSFTEWLDHSAVSIAKTQADPFALRVFPNPAMDKVTVVFNSNSASMDLQVVDVRGATVLHVVTMDRSIDLDLSRWNAGIYQVLLTSADGQRSARRLVVAH